MGDSAQPSLDNERPPKRQKSMTVIACNSCKRRKSKCNGARPACDRCLRLNEQCHYELDSTISRQDGLKRRLREVTARSDALEALVAQLRSASDQEAADLIRLLRQGADVQDLADRTSAPSSSRLSSIADEDNHQSYPSPPVEDSGFKVPLLSMTGADWRRAASSRTSDSQDDDKEQSIGSTRSSTPWADPSSPLPRLQQASASGESELPPLIPQHKRRRLGPLTVSRGYVEAFGNMSTSSSIMAGHYPVEIQKQQVSNFQIPVHFLQPCWELDDAPFSRVVQDYRNLARMHYASKPLPDLSRIDVTYFFVDRALTAGDVPSVSTWASEMNKSFEDVDVFVRLACLYFQTQLMMWMINPTAETYAKMPDLIKPTPMQMMVPHISPLDTVPLCV
ncbi:Nitrogen assimilation transcription factor nit-4 [Lasiodiplodia theobromae]|uniref:Nitrogen assimilation transcription factor nit-4 n=1 Tax=Lasiodiplodia theobromae TaxID=45133 RepID=A0A5N5DAR2_9PEZI|nr:Nitrogen assimilation transcription factor nit-4 [Lasiodiplodia theobromae]